MELRNKEWFMVWLPRSLRYLMIFIFTLISIPVGLVVVILASYQDYPFDKQNGKQEKDGNKN